MVSGTFVFSSPPATSPATDTGECWLRRRDSRPHVLQNAGAQDPTPPPTIAPRTRSPSPCLLRCRGPARMPADRQDVQPAFGHDLLASPVPRLLPRL